MILLVEDNPDHAEIVMRSFKAHQVDHPVLHVTDEETALDYLHRRSEYAHPEKSPRPELVLLDLRLPKMNGLEVLKEIKESKALCGIPVVILTSSQIVDDVEMAFEYHANSYIVKPLEFREFMELMRGVASYWLNCNVNPRGPR
ncbi:MAG: response regulator [Desulfomonilaceae bacterium]